MQATSSSSKTTTHPVTRATTSTTTPSSTQKSPKSPKSPPTHHHLTHTVTSNASVSIASDSNSEIEEISKKISEHADAIYRTWKCRGLAPTELLEFYTSTAASVTEATATSATTAAAAAAGMSGSDLLLQSDGGSTEGLQKLVNSFVIKDKEQRGVKIASAAGGGSNKSQIKIAAKNAEVVVTSKTNNLANKTSTQKSNNLETIKQQQSPKSPILLTHDVNQNATKNSTTTATTTLKKSNTAATTKTTRTASITASEKNNACVKNFNDNVNDHKTEAPTTSLLYGKKTTIGGTTVKPKTLTKESEIPLKLGLDLELNSLNLTQTQNLRKIKELLQQEETNNNSSTETMPVAVKAKKISRTSKMDATKLESSNNVTITPATTTTTTATKQLQRTTDNNNDNNRKTFGKSNNLGGNTSSSISRDLTDVATTDVANHINTDKNSGGGGSNKRTTTKVNAKTLHNEIQLQQPQSQQQQQQQQTTAISKVTREDVKSTVAASNAKNTNKVVKSTTKESGVINNGKTTRAEKLAAEKLTTSSASPSPTAAAANSEKKDSKSSVGAETVMEVARNSMPAPTKVKSARPLTNGLDKNLGRPILTRGSVAERVMLFEKCPDIRTSFLNIKRPDPVDAVPKVPIKVKLHSTPPQPPEQNSLQREIRTSKSVYIPRFYFPHGKPQPQIALERTLRGILSAFDSFPNNQVTKDELPRILKLCGLPFYWRMPVMVFCQQQNSGLVERQRFVEFWKQMNVYCHEDASRFVYILSRGQRFRSHILPEDFAPLVQDVVETHPGLAFLKEATEFHSRYVHTVIARIFYSVNRSWSGKISIAELKKSDLLEIISLLEDEDDINQVLAFFSYEHFYVIYCKFWELDKDHDLLINQEDLARHSDHALSTRIVERIFSGCVTRGDKQKSTDDEPKMSYTDFVWFLLSEEDKRTPTAIEYWFRCMDVDGDGVLSMYELEYFYEEQQQRMESIGIETLPFEDCLCQMLDMIKPQRRDCVTLGDLKRCKMTHVFFDTFFNLEKYLDHEQRDPFASQRDEYSSDWDRFAAQEYELLITEEND